MNTKKNSQILVCHQMFGISETTTHNDKSVASSPVATYIFHSPPPFQAYRASYRPSSIRNASLSTA